MQEIDEDGDDLIDFEEFQDFLEDAKLGDSIPKQTIRIFFDQFADSENGGKELDIQMLLMYLAKEYPDFKTHVKAEKERTGVKMKVTVKTYLKHLINNFTPIIPVTEQV